MTEAELIAQLGAPADFACPNWDDYNKEYKHVHDWRRYMNGALRVHWPHMTLISRAVVAVALQDTADKEEWD